MNIQEFTDRIKDAFPASQVQTYLSYDGTEQTVMTQVQFNFQTKFTLSGVEEDDMNRSNEIITAVRTELGKQAPLTETKKKK